MERRTILLAAIFGLTVAGCEHAPPPYRFSHVRALEHGWSCVDCHGASPAPTLERALVFSHDVHRAPSAGNCMRCHQAVATATAKVEMPSMDSCADGCHAEDFQELRCKLCHLDLARYPLESVKSWAHTREFERRHGPAARRDPATCTTCHEASYCTDCHSDANSIALDLRRIEAVTRNFIHPAPYVEIHAIDAKSQKDNCSSCHRSTFCTSCHATYGLAGVENTSKTHHPNGWLDPGSASFHGLEARRAIASCAGCHDRGAQSVCVRCHQVGGTGGNPHPREILLRDEDPRRNRMCRTCHI